MLRSGTYLFSVKCHVGTQDSRYLRTEILLVPCNQQTLQTQGFQICVNPHFTVEIPL
jgi:hypothetical protein